MRETRIVPQSSANESDTALLGKEKENAQPAVFSVGWKVRGAGCLGRERSMQEM